MRLSGQRLTGMRPSGMRPNGMRPNGMRPNGMRLKGCGSRERGLKECGPTACNLAYLAPYQPGNVAYRIVYTATEQRPDFKLIRKIFLPKCACLRGSAPDPAGGLTAPPDPQLEKVGLHTNPSGWTDPHFHQMSRGPAKSADVPHFSKMVLLFFPTLFYMFASQRNKVTNFE